MARSLIHDTYRLALPWRDYIPAAGLSVVGAVILAWLTLFTGGVAGHYLVVVPPWADAGLAAQVVYASGGLLVGTSALPNMVVAAAGDNPDFTAALRANGAWLVLPAPAAGCYGQEVRAP